jgi:hypothetical protein
MLKFNTLLDLVIGGTFEGSVGDLVGLRELMAPHPGFKKGM